MNNLEKRVLEFISFFSSMGRAVSLLEIKTFAPLKSSISLNDIFACLSHLQESEKISEIDGFYSIPNTLIANRTAQDFLLDKKWKRLLKRATWFNSIPFIDFVVVSGSMSLGAVHKTSDFDIVLGIKKERLYTTRYFVNFVFKLLGILRKDDLSASSPDKFCFNHVITKATYVKPPINYYRYELYKHMIPIYVRGNSYNDFVEKNNWADMSTLSKGRTVTYSPTYLKTISETLLGGKLGDIIEKNIAKPIAKRRLAHYISQKPAGGRVIVNDEELEFHFKLNYEEQFKAFSIDKT